MNDAIDALGFVANSHNRVRILELLADRDRASRDELRERTDASRTTLQRNLHALEERGWIDRDDRVYSLSLKGQHLTADLRRTLETTDTPLRLAPLLECVSTDTFDLETQGARRRDPPDARGRGPVRDAEPVHRSTPGRGPRAGLLPVTGLRSWEVAHERTLAGDLACEILVDPEVADTILTSPDYRPLLEDLLETGRHDVYRVDERVPYLLVQVDDWVQIGGHDENRVPQAMVGTDRDEVYEWAGRTYESYRRRAEPIADVVTS